MNHKFSRRGFLRMIMSVPAGALLASCNPRVRSTPTSHPETTPGLLQSNPPATAPTATTTPIFARPKKIYKGYYFVQDVETYSTSQFGAISTPSEAEKLCGMLLAHPVSGVEYGPDYFDPDTISACLTIADVFSQHGIDLWLTSWYLGKRIRAFNSGTFPEQYLARQMTPEGVIIPATTLDTDLVGKIPAFDYLNPEAVSWLVDRYKEVYLKPLAPFTSGYYLNEDTLYDQNPPQNNDRISYWELPVYSDAVLGLWQQFCGDHAVTSNGEQVSKFPVHSESMAANGGGKTQYFPGYEVPPVVGIGTPIVSIPRDNGVWESWDEFLTTQFAKTWIGELSKAAYEVNSGNPNFKGVIYSGAHVRSLAYEEVGDPTFVVDPYQQWVPWGTQHGSRLAKTCALPYVDYVVCETFPPIRANLLKFASEFKRIITDQDTEFGIQLHRDDNWGLDQRDLETERWEIIKSLQPMIITRFPINRLFPSDQYYNAQKEALFDERLLAYRK